MKIIKKISSAIFGAMLFPLVVVAQIEPIAPGGYGSVGSVQDLIHKIENAVGLVFGCIAVIMFVFAGIKFMTAQGDADKVKDARGAFLWGIAGVVVGLIAFSIIAIVGSFIR